MKESICVKEIVEHQCPVAATLKLIGGKYKALILWNLIDKPLRPCELKRIIVTATQNMITKQLRELEKDGIVEREMFLVTPFKVEYSLTDYGRTLISVLDAMCKWGSEHLQKKEQMLSVVNFELIEYQCPVETTLKVIGGKYKALILFHLIDKKMRYSELIRAVKLATPKMLTQQLRELENDSCITREMHPVVPPKVEYSLNDYGQTFIPILDAMCNWGTEHLILKSQPSCTSDINQSLV